MLVKFCLFLIIFNCSKIFLLAMMTSVTIAQRWRRVLVTEGSYFACIVTQRYRQCQQYELIPCAAAKPRQSQFQSAAADTMLAKYRGSITDYQSMQRKQQLRLMLQRQPLLQNLRQVFELNYRKLCQMFAAATLQQRRQASWLSALKLRLSQTVESLLDFGCSSPHYVCTSPAMNIFNVAELAANFNALLVEYLLINDEYIVQCKAASVCSKCS
ncbi:uncharacterized protein LOC108602623 [Drosophila busckii]|uniref:uncharacterized protein LOC108602623 n=1 Tax=Drosophila busckii TaxID=30019 RepID=UPI00083F069E|nr:uncharacterized protein LOC108602623 [Drosophila busckii]